MVCLTCTIQCCRNKLTDFKYSMAYVNVLRVYGRREGGEENQKHKISMTILLIAYFQMENGMSPTTIQMVPKLGPTHYQYHLPSPCTRITSYPETLTSAEPLFHVFTSIDHLIQMLGNYFCKCCQNISLYFWKQRSCLIQCIWVKFMNFTLLPSSCAHRRCHLSGHC